MPATARKLTGAEDWARCPVPPPTSGRMCGLTRASTEKEGAEEEEEGEWRRRAGGGLGAEGVPRALFAAGIRLTPASSRA